MGRKRQDNSAVIESCAMKEFLQYGYRDASMRRVAEAAGVTTGTIYARYQSKDALFQSLVAPVVQAASMAFQTPRPIYYAAKTADDMQKAMQAEAEVTLHALFDHYDAATLLLCRSEGSLAAGFFDELTRQKVEESDQFFCNFPKSDDMKHAFEVLLTVQFDMYRQILENGYTRQEAENCMKILSQFMNAGWGSIMEDLLKEKEG